MQEKLRFVRTNSSNLKAIAYYPGSVRFYVQFQNGTWYCYEVGQECASVVTDILFAESQGTAFNELKNSRVPYVKVENPEEFGFHE